MRDTKKRLLEFAAAKLGRAELAARLKVPESMIEDWLESRAEMSSTKSLALADLVAELNKQQ